MSSIIVKRPPQTKTELWWWLKAVTGQTVPPVKCCANHVAPLDVAWAIYTRQHPVIVIKASRGLAGKSQLLATIAVGLSIIQGVEVLVLGGSMHQSLNVQKISSDLWDFPNMPRDLLLREPTKTEYVMRHGGRVRAVPASQKSVRGPHPNILLMDEIDEMDLEVLDSAMGMPMSKKGHRAVTVMSSTHQYPFGSMTEILNRANDNVDWWSVMWCWRESSSSPHGWLDPMAVEQKRMELSRIMFDVEVELQDPVVDGTLFPPEHVYAMWDEARGTYEGKPSEYLEFEEPQIGVKYATGVDWAKSKDWTVITTRRMDTWELVAWERMQRLPWPFMIRKALDRVKRYPGSMAHDATGIGDVIADVFPEEVRRFRNIHDVVMRGSERSELFTEYMTALESNTFHGPHVRFARSEHLYCTWKDIFTVAGHPPDSIVAECMAWYCRGKSQAGKMTDAVVQPRNSSPWAGGLSTDLAGMSVGSDGWGNWQG